MGDLEIDESEISALELPVESVQFLCGQQMQAEQPLLVEFKTIKGTFPVLNDYALSKNAQLLVDGNDFYRIGTDDATQICIQKKTGLIFAIDLEQCIPRRYVNSNIKFFVEFLNLFKTYESQVVEFEDDEESSSTLVKNVVAEMRKIDIDAFRNPDDWWPTVTQQMEFGLM